jgi:hypothetical protein
LLLARSDRPIAQVVQEITDVVARLEPTLPTFGAGSVEQIVSVALIPNRVAALALTAFGVLALMLAGRGRSWSRGVCGRATPAGDWDQDSHWR